MPKGMYEGNTTVRIPISDMMAKRIRMGDEVTVKLSGKVKEITDPSAYYYGEEEAGESMYEICLSVQKPDIQAELMKDREAMSDMMRM